MDTTRAMKIKIALIQMGKKQVDIAKELEVTPATVSDVINGKRTSRRVMNYINEIIKKSCLKCPVSVTEYRT